ADVVERGLAGQPIEAVEPGEPALDADRVGGGDTLGMVEAAGQQLDDVAAGLAVAEWRAAGGAEIAFGARGGAEVRRLPLGPGEVGPWYFGQYGERSGHGLLAHAAV